MSEVVAAIADERDTDRAWMFQSEPLLRTTTL